MQRLRRLCDAHWFLDSVVNRTAGRVTHVCQPDSAAYSLLSPPSCAPAPEQPVSCIGYASTQTHQVMSDLRNAAALPLAARESSAMQQPLLASANSLTATKLHITVSQLGPAATSQLHTSASMLESSPSGGHKSGSVPQPESAARQQQSGPDISLLNATQQSHWDHANNAHLGNILIKPQSHCKAHWTCMKCTDGLPHLWTAAVYNLYKSSRNNRSGCPYCVGQAVCAHNSLAQQAPLLSLEWDTTRNIDTPQDYTLMSDHRAYWVCLEGHQWHATIKDRVRRNQGCPECAGARRRQRAPILTASSGNIMQVWDDTENAKAGLDPHKLTCGSAVKAHFKCPQNHQWTARIVDIARNVHKTGCPTCSRLSTRKQSRVMLAQSDEPPDHAHKSEGC